MTDFNEIFYQGQLMRCIKPIIESAEIDELQMEVNSDAIMQRLLSNWGNDNSGE